MTTDGLFRKDFYLKNCAAPAVGIEKKVKLNRRAHMALV